MIEKDVTIDIATYIDHSLLNPTATPEDVEECCKQAQHFGFPTICVYPSAVSQTVKLVHDK